MQLLVLLRLFALQVELLGLQLYFPLEKLLMSLSFPVINNDIRFVVKKMTLIVNLR